MGWRSGKSFFRVLNLPSLKVEGKRQIREGFCWALGVLAVG